MFKMWYLGRGTALCILFSLACLDTRARAVPVCMLRVSAAAVLLYQIFCCSAAVWEILAGAGAGIMFLVISRTTGEGMGYGDSWGILILGVYLGIRKLLEVLTASFLFLAVYSAVLLSRKKMSRRCRIPFYPFLTFGYVVLLLAEGGIL